jgi:hypothetical protein
LLWRIQRLLYLFPVEHSSAPDSREAFIARQIAGLRELGVPEETLAREEALLRGGLAASRVFANLWAALPDTLHGRQ